MDQSNPFRIHRTVIGILTVLLLEAGLNLPAFAQEMHRFEINATDAATAIHEFGNQSGVQILVSADALRGKRLNTVAGNLSTDDGLKKLLADTGLSHRYVGERAVALVTDSPMPVSQRTAEGKQKGFWERIRLALNDQARQGSDASQSEEPISEELKTDQPSDRKDDQRVQLGEVLVTATKRRQSVQDVPLSIAVIGNQDIERRGLIGMEDYLRQIPGVNQMDKGGMDNAIVIRGISTSAEASNTIVGSGATVATYFDETPITGSVGMGQGGGIDLRTVDFERIEVLRGPQGTAWGNSSLGGAMRLIPAKPELDEFDAKVASYVSVTEGHGSENWMGQGVINIPVVKDRFAIRGVGYRYDESGFYRNIAGNHPETIAMAEGFSLGDYVRGHVQDDVGEMRTTGGRFAALWQVTGKLDLSLSFLTQKIEQDGTPVASVGDFEQARVPIAPQGRVRGEVGEVADTEMDLANLALTYDFGWAEWKSIVSRVDSGQVFAQGWGLPFAFFGPISGTIRSDFESFTAETRLVSQFSGPFQILGGLFYEDVEESFVQSFGDWPGTPETNLFVTNPMFFSEGFRQLDQYAIFGEVSYGLTDKLTATAGGRYFDYDKDETQLFEGGLIGVPLGEGVPIDLGINESGSTYKANLSYKPREDWLLYASWAEGFRLGRGQRRLGSFCDVDNDGIVDGTNIPIDSTASIDADFLEQYELGGKFAQFDRRLVVDAAVYYIEWTGLPILTFAACGGGNIPSSFVANGGEATSIGAEFQVSVLVTEGLRLDFGAGYANAELSEDAPALGAEDGDRLPASPEWNANLSVQYDFEFLGYSAFVRADSFYTGESFSNLPATPDKRAGDYIKVDARAGVAIGNLSAELFVRNLTNEDAFTWRGIVQGGGDFRLRPRTVGIQFGYRFE